LVKVNNIRLKNQHQQQQDNMQILKGWMDVGDGGAHIKKYQVEISVT